MSELKVVVNGAKGRMGKEAVQAISAQSDMKVVFEADRGDDLQSILTDLKPDVVVDLTVASVGFKNAKIILENKVRPVIGTSGFKKTEVDFLIALAEKNSVGGIIAPNFALGAVLMMKFSKIAAQYMDSAEIIELHHEKKEDFPSGTAIKTAELIAENSNMKSFNHEGRGVVHAGIPVHSVRLPGFVAHQEVIFGGLGQVLTLRHDSLNRESFMPGILLACRKVMGLDHLVYGLDNLI